MNRNTDIRIAVPCRTCKATRGEACFMLTGDGQRQQYLEDSFVHATRREAYDRYIEVEQRRTVEWYRD